MYNNRRNIKKAKSIKALKRMDNEETQDTVKPVLLEEKKELDPESDVLLSQSVADTVQTIDDPLNSDDLLVSSEETTDDKLKREILTASEEGAQPEGMVPPIEEFENNSLRRQLLTY
jgi:hypothetical protein